LSDRADLDYFGDAAAVPLLTQVGGDHYKKLAIQPIEYAMKNGLDGCQHNVVKYVTRFRDKGGLADLEKAKHYLDLLIYFETVKYDQEKTQSDSKRPSDTEVPY
jgi:hypothetical protein